MRERELSDGLCWALGADGPSAGGEGGGSGWTIDPINSRRAVCAATAIGMFPWRATLRKLRKHTVYESNRAAGGPRAWSGPIRPPRGPCVGAAKSGCAAANDQVRPDASECEDQVVDVIEHQRNGAVASVLCS